MTLIDTHAHLTMADYDGGIDGILQRARLAGVRRCILAGTTLEDSRRNTELVAQHQGELTCTVGIHPHEAESLTNDALATLADLARRPGVVAIGETGLDYYRNHAPRDAQQRAFARQLELAASLDLPVVVHCRDALDDCLAILDDAVAAAPLAAVFHCFSSGPNDAGRVLDRGFHLSFTGVVTFNNARELQQVAAAVPNDRYMLETDCPFLAPAPKRGHWPNEPALLPLVAQKIAQLRGQSADEIADTTSENAGRFFRLARS